MGVAAEDVWKIERWGPVSRGVHVSFPGGASGRVTEIGPRDRGVELLVESPSSRARAVAGADIVGGIIRMPGRHSSRLGAPHEEAA